MPEYKPTKRGSYVRRRLATSKKPTSPPRILASEMIQACNTALRRMGAPINHSEEMHIKAVVKEQRQKRKEASETHDAPADE